MLAFRILQLQPNPDPRGKVCVSHILHHRHLSVMYTHDTLPNLQVLLVQLLLELVVVRHCAGLELWDIPLVTIASLSHRKTP